MKREKTRSKDEVEKAVNKKSKDDKKSDKPRRAVKPKADLSEFSTFLTKSDKGRVVLSVQEYGGKKYVDIRHYYKDPAGEWKPTKKGTSIPLEKGTKLAKKLRMLIASATEAGLPTTDE